MSLWITKRLGLLFIFSDQRTKDAEFANYSNAQGKKTMDEVHYVFLVLFNDVLEYLVTKESVIKLPDFIEENS